MKKIKQIIIALLVLQSTFIIAQSTPQGINYQAVARDANGNARVNQQIPVQFTIYQSSATGTVVWQERQVKTTNSMGQFNAVIGTGASVTPFTPISFSQINWGSDSTFLKVEINANISFTGVFSQIGSTSKFQAVPYAMYAMNNNLKAPTMQIFKVGSGTYTTPAGVLYLEIEMVGGGAGGSSAYGGGGGAGGYMKFMITAPASLYSYTVGLGGASSGNATATTFGSNVAGGGSAGGNGNGSSAGGYGGAGGTNTFITGTAIVNLTGASGTGGSGANAGGGPGGAGGSSPFGGAGGGGRGAGDGSASASCSGSPAVPNSGSGGGGGGVDVNNGSGSGAIGATGVIIVKEYYK